MKSIPTSALQQTNHQNFIIDQVNYIIDDWERTIKVKLDKRPIDDIQAGKSHYLECVLGANDFLPG